MEENDLRAAMVYACRYCTARFSYANQDGLDLLAKYGHLLRREDALAIKANVSPAMYHADEWTAALNVLIGSKEDA